MSAHIKAGPAGMAYRYGLAVAVVALALAVGQLLLPQASDAGAHMLLLTAVAAAAWCGGPGPGVAAALLATVAGAYLALPETSWPAMADASASSQLGFLLAEGLIIGLLIGTLTERVRRAQHALCEQDDQLALAAHELKTPLTTIVGYTQALQLRAAREGHLSRRDQDTLRVIAGQARRLHGLIDSILDLARLHNGQMQIASQALDLAALARRVVDEAGLVATRHRVVFHGPDTPLVIRGDRVRLEQVLQNLVENAVKYSPAGGDVTVRAERRNAEAVLAISDQGIGIPEEARAQLFDRFYRADNVDRRKMQGTGIGLSITAEIVALHGGAVEVDSLQGQGSIFTIRLPLDDTLTTDAARAARQRLSSGPAVPARSLESPAAKRYHEQAR